MPIEDERNQQVTEGENMHNNSTSPHSDNATVDLHHELKDQSTIINQANEQQDSKTQASRLPTVFVAGQQDLSTKTKNILKPPSASIGGQNEVEHRKGSVVYFENKCQLHVIDPFTKFPQTNDNSRKPIKPPALTSVRYYIMFLALISPFVVTYSKTIINFAIIDMIHPDYMATSQIKATNRSEQLKQDDVGDILPKSIAIEPESLLIPTTTTPVPEDEKQYFELDNSCPVTQEDRDRLINSSNQDKKRANQRPGEKFEWDTVKQGLLKGAYSIGHSLFSIFGGRLAEIFGSHRTMGISSLLIGACCLIAPFFASVHFYFLFADLFLLGILGSFMTPALITLFTNWLTPSEKSIMISFYLVSSRLGYALSSLLCGLLINAELSWRYLFYSAGWVSIGFTVLFFLLAQSNPTEHPFISQEELIYLASKNTLVRENLLKKQENDLKTKNHQAPAIEMSSKNDVDGLKDKPIEDKTKTKKTSAPWGAILTSVPVWAFIITKFCVKLAGDTVQIELPAYLSRVMHFSSKDNGFINSSNYVIFCLSCLLVGGLAKTANKKHPFGWTKTTVRKFFQSIASFGVAIILLGISLSVCNNTMTLILLMLMFFFTTFGVGGEAQIPMDLSERYAGTIHAIGSSLAFSGAIEPILVGFLLKGHAADKDRWALVWVGASGFAAFGGLAFLFFGDASKQKFDEIGQEKQKQDYQNEIDDTGSDKREFELDANNKKILGSNQLSEVVTGDGVNTSA